jgi:choice-of-anchor B domain-containing protein
MGLPGFRGVGKRRQPAPRGAPHLCSRLSLDRLEDRLVPSALTKVGQWNNGTGLYSDGWAVTQNNRQYAYIGHYGNNNGIHIVDVTDPSSPFLVSNFKSASGWNDFRDVDLEQKGGGRRTFGFFSSDSGGGVVVANVSNPAQPVEIFRITSAHQGHNNVHTLSVDGNYLYEADSRSSTIKVFDIKNPASPKFVRNIVSATSDVHEVTALNGRLYVAGIFNDPRVEVYDISQVGDLGKPVTRLGTVFSGTRAHTAWPTEDGQFVAVAHEKQGGNLSFWNISNPASPQLAWSIQLPTSQSYCVHQVMIKGNRLYASWYQAGIYVYDITDRYNPVLLGNYDTYAGPVNGYDGAWGVFPYLGDDKILGFDMQGGLFILALTTGDGGAGSSPGVQPIITLGANESPVGLEGGVLRVVLDNSGQTVQVSQNIVAGTMDVTLDGDQVFQFPASDVLRLNLYGGTGDDRFVFDPTITQPILVDGGDGANSVRGWPALYAGTGITGSDHHTRVTGVQRGKHYNALSIQVFEDGVQFLGTSAWTGHGGHGSGFANMGSFGVSNTITSDHAQMLAGLPGGMNRADAMAATMGSLHAGGAISPELMARTSLNSQVGGQVAYHKPG